MENEADNGGRKKRPGYLTAYANHAGITKTAAAKQLARVGVDYFKPFDHAEADRLRKAARHADREKFAKPIYVQPGENPLGDDGEEDDLADSNNPAIAKSQAKKEEFRAKLVELEYEERVGTLVRKEEVERESFRVGRLVRDGVLNVPARVSGIISAAIMSILGKFLESIISDLDERRRILDLLEREIGKDAMYAILEKELRQALEALALDDDEKKDPEAA